VARNDQTRYKTFWAMVIADKSPKKKGTNFAEGNGSWDMISENPISTIKNFICNYADDPREPPDRREGDLKQ
jgi:hypothetical protein